FRASGFSSGCANGSRSRPYRPADTAFAGSRRSAASADRPSLGSAGDGGMVARYRQRNRGAMSTGNTSAPTASSAPSRTRRRLILEYLIGSSPWRAITLALLSVLTGLAEAGLLAIVAQIAAALATRAGNVEAHLGVVDLRISVGGLLIAGGALALARFALLVPTSSIAARLTADAMATMRRRL